jgi:hypothetical protein
MKVFVRLLVLLFLHATLIAQQPDAKTSQIQTPQPAQKQKPQAAKKKEPPKQLQRTRIDASMVGYIDPSAIQTEVRIRFDAGFNAPRPDRAEFFYAGCNGSSSCFGGVQRTLNFQQLYFNGEYAPLKHFSGFVQVPFRWVQPFFVPNTGPPTLTSGGGISDLQAGLKFGAIATSARNLTFEVGADFPTGNGANGLGTNHYSIEPKVLFFQRLSDRTAFEAEAGDSHPIGGTLYYATPSSSPRTYSGDVAMYGVGPSYQLVARDNYRITPVFELVSWHVFGGLQAVPGSTVQSAAGINILNAKLGARLSFLNGNSIYAGYGRSVTSDVWYKNLFRIEYRHVF